MRSVSSIQHEARIIAHDRAASADVRRLAGLVESLAEALVEAQQAAGRASDLAKESLAEAKKSRR